VGSFGGRNRGAAFSGVFPLGGQRGAMGSTIGLGLYVCRVECGGLCPPLPPSPPESCRALRGAAGGYACAIGGLSLTVAPHSPQQNGGQRGAMLAVLPTAV
jgi:hypothetical protein